MAKDVVNTNIFAKTEAGGAVDNSDLDQGNIRPLGVGLRAGEVAALDAIANQYEISRNAVIRYAIRYFIEQHRLGKADMSKEVETPPTPKKRVKFPKAKQ